MDKKDSISIPDELVVEKIYLIRGEKVMLDKDLAALYDVDTKHLKRQVARNIDRFPEDFMFQLTDFEYVALRSQIGALKRGPACQIHAVCFHRARGFYVIRRSEKQASYLGKHPDHPRVYSVA